MAARKKARHKKAKREAHEEHKSELEKGRCPLCTKEGLILLGIAIVLVAINNTYTRYLAWVFLLAAFFVPLIKNAYARQR